MQKPVGLEMEKKDYTENTSNLKNNEERILGRSSSRPLKSRNKKILRGRWDRGIRCG